MIEEKISQEHGTGSARTAGVVQRTAFYLLGSLCLVVGISAAADALVVTDHERMEEFVESVTGPVSDARIDGALDYADPTRQSLDVVHERRMERYDTENASSLPQRVREALAPLTGSKLRLIQESISIEDDLARVALRVRTDAGLANAVFDLRRHDDQWLLRRVMVN